MIKIDGSWWTTLTLVFNFCLYCLLWKYFPSNAVSVAQNIPTIYSLELFYRLVLSEYELVQTFQQFLTLFFTNVSESGTCCTCVNSFQSCQICRFEKQSFHNILLHVYLEGNHSLFIILFGRTCCLSFEFYYQGCY